MQENLNTPPFAVGQKVIALCSGPKQGVKKGDILTVAECFLSNCQCSKWMVAIEEYTAVGEQSICQKCNGIYDHFGIKNLCGDARRFAPIQTQYTDITKEIADNVKETVEAPDKILIPQTVNN